MERYTYQMDSDSDRMNSYIVQLDGNIIQMEAYIDWMESYIVGMDCYIDQIDNDIVQIDSDIVRMSAYNGTMSRDVEKMGSRGEKMRHAATVLAVFLSARLSEDHDRQVVRTWSARTESGKVIDAYPDQLRRRALRFPRDKSRELRLAVLFIVFVQTFSESVRVNKEKVAA